jgi:hypothetical protein
VLHAKPSLLVVVNRSQEKVLSSSTTARQMPSGWRWRPDAIYARSWEASFRLIFTSSTGDINHHRTTNRFLNGPRPTGILLSRATSQIMSEHCACQLAVIVILQSGFSTLRTSNAWVSTILMREIAMNTDLLKRTDTAWRTFGALLSDLPFGSGF